MHRLLSLLALSTVTCQRGAPSEIEKRLHAISSAEMAISVSEMERLARIRAAYNDLAFAAFGRVDDHDIALLFEGAYREAFYVHDTATIGEAETLLEAMQRRGIARDEHYRKMHETFMGARMFEDARALEQQHPVPGLEAAPELHIGELVPGRPSELVVDPTEHVLLRRTVDLQPAQVVVVSHPRCHFSANAMQDIEADPVLRTAFKHARWLAPQHDNLEFDSIQQWNRDHPDMAHSISYRNDEWPIDWWGTPTFYFIEDGAVRAKVVGWPKEGSRTELLAGLKQIGLL